MPMGEKILDLIILIACVAMLSGCGRKPAIKETPTTYEMRVSLKNQIPSTSSVEAKLHVVDIIPLSNSGETNQDSEPNLSLNPLNPQQIVASAFTPGPFDTQSN